MQEIEILRLVTIALVILTTLCFLYQTVYLFLPFILKKKAHKEAKPNRYAILIAARNEEAVIPHLLDSIREQDYPAELITTYVIADNCTDNTARVARAHGATVFTRFNQQQIGKGYALNYLLEQLRLSGELDQFDAFLIFDADNLLLPDYVTQINRVCSDGYEAFCGYRNAKNFGSNWLTCGYGLFYLHESVHLNLSRMRIGACCAVNGTGFGFTRELLTKCGGWNYFTLTEDIEFSTWCAANGVVIGYCNDAILFDEHPTAFRQSWRQRTRWAQGGIQVSFRYARDMFSGICKGGMTGYSSFERTTMSLWGVILCLITGAFASALLYLTYGWKGVAFVTAFSSVGAFLSFFFLGAFTLYTEWDRIRATKAQKLKSLFAYPLFMLTFAPISIAAPFQKFQWKPIVHSVAISAKSLQGN
ncbi:MAG: glycosyltransferase family 2 protein [Oscillospiraceae bacterium]|nr:glycosyltransferase family 2 protein [Oscillospiraceae bacterium]